MEDCGARQVNEVASGSWFDRLLSVRRSGASRFYHLDAL